jgi:hypothetical protein
LNDIKPAAVPQPTSTPKPGTTPQSGTTTHKPGPSPKVIEPGKISNSPQNRLIETGIPRKDGNGWVKRWTRITPEDEQKMAQAISEFDYQLYLKANELRLSSKEATQYKFIKMQEFGTNLRKDFLKNRSY